LAAYAAGRGLGGAAWQPLIGKRAGQLRAFRTFRRGVPCPMSRGRLLQVVKPSGSTVRRIPHVEV